MTVALRRIGGLRRLESLEGLAGPHSWRLQNWLHLPMTGSGWPRIDSQSAMGERRHDKKRERTAEAESLSGCELELSTRRRQASSCPA